MLGRDKFIQNEPAAWFGGLHDKSQGTATIFTRIMSVKHGSVISELALVKAVRYEQRRQIAKDLYLLEYVAEFSQLAILTVFDVTALNSLFWIGACPLSSLLPRSPLSLLFPSEAQRRVTDTKSNPGRAPVSTSSQERATVSKSSTERAPIFPSSLERDFVPELSPEWASVPECSPERACVRKSCQGEALVPTGSPRRAFVPECSPKSPEAHKCPPAPAFSPAVVWQPLCSPSAHHLCSEITVGLPVSIGIMAGGSPVSTSSLRLSTGWASSSLRPRLGLSSTILRLGTPVLQLRLVPQSLRLRQAPPSPQFHFSPLDPPRHPGSLALCLGLLCHLRLRRWFGPLESSVFPPPWLLPQLAPLWVPITDVAWVPPSAAGSKSLLSSPLPPSSPPWTLSPEPPSGRGGPNVMLADLKITGTLRFPYSIQESWWVYILQVDIPHQLPAGSTNNNNMCRTVGLKHSISQKQQMK
ncbi:Glucans biosynthesis protein G [Labeo rohita]|uniref:Glucans biosynthesis protein G n=1 Tax=Labeo rohita TaxID=84645 RepID=A0ABQ8MCG4_LABRO|nr:Glucans biosynthesis protein G [Labeo rohita]